MATREVDSRLMGYALSKLYKGAYATYRDNMYKVDTIETGKSLILDWEVYEAMKQRLRLLDPKTFAGMCFHKFKKPETNQELIDYFKEFNEKIQIREPSRIEARLTPELECFMCYNCNNFVTKTSFVDGINQFRFICRNCKSLFSQAPILVRNKKANEDRRNAPIVLPIRMLPKKVCPGCGNEDWPGLEIRDFEQPMGSLTWVCKKCNFPLSPFQSYKFGYRPQEPTENLTRGITVSLSNAEDSTLNKVDVEGFLNKKFCKGIFYSDKVDVYQVTWGYKIGQYEKARVNTFRDTYYGRNFRTQGIVIELDESIYNESLNKLKEIYEEDEELYKRFLKDIENDDLEMRHLQLKRWVLHTLKHMILMYLPVITGLPHREFGGSYDLDKNRVIIYDNQENGIGGCQKLWKDQKNLTDLFDLMTETIERCDCRSKCPKCILLDNCGEVNQALNRHLLVPLFEDVETFYD